MGISEEIKKAKAVIFDLDGTIVDSMWMWGQIDIDYLNMLNLECPSDIQKSIEGMSFYETAEYFKDRFNIDDSLDKIMECWNDMAFDKYLNVVMEKPGITDFIRYLKENDYKLGVATSNSRHLASAALKGKDILDYFDAIVTGDECTIGKPEPDVFLLTAAELDTDPSECIVFEDLPAGISAGKSAGMKTVAIADSYSEKMWDQKIEMADYYISDYREILDEIYNS